MNMNMVSAGPHSGDAVLWQRVVAGDHEAFGELFDRYAGAVYTYLFRRLGNWAEAGDLTSAVFLQAWRRRSEVVFDRDSALPWLLGVANGLLRNATRARQRHAALLARIRDRAPDPAAAGADHADAVADRLDTERKMAGLRAAVARLPRREREVIELCVWAGLDQAAAAVALNIRPGTVKSRLHRARRSLARELGEEALCPPPTASRRGCDRCRGMTSTGATCSPPSGKRKPRAREGHADGA
jgi:RNA polymerase sigma factor (sigma-70 family)